jgi:hypothetical protein
MCSTLETAASKASILSSSRLEALINKALGVKELIEVVTDDE